MRATNGLGVAVVTVLITSTTAQITGCAYGCLWSQFNEVASYPNGLCGDVSAVGVVNSCIASSSCSATDKNAAYRSLAQECANLGISLTASAEATFSIISGASIWPTSLSVSGVSTNPWEAYSSYYSGSATTDAAVTTTNSAGSTTLFTTTASAGNDWPFGYGGYGPWTSSGSWTDGPWTSWWDQYKAFGGCPGSTWSGWTSGSWSTSAPWTSWTACSATTTATSVITTTDSSGSTATITSFGIKVADAPSTSVTSNSASASATISALASASATAGTGNAGNALRMDLGTGFVSVLALVIGVFLL